MSEGFKSAFLTAVALTLSKPEQAELALAFALTLSDSEQQRVVWSLLDALGIHVLATITETDVLEGLEGTDIVNATEADIQDACAMASDADWSDMTDAARDMIERRLEKVLRERGQLKTEEEQDDTNDLSGGA